MFEQDESMLRFGVTPVENLFIQEYLPAARGDYVKVYLYALYISAHPKKELSAAEIAQELGMPEDNVIILEMGQALELSEDEANITGPIPNGSVMVDGLGVGDVGNVVLRDRKHLSQDGLIIVVVGVNRETGLVTSGPELISRGFVYVRENEELISGARNVAMNVLQRYDRIEQSDWTSVKNGIKDEMHNYLFDLIKRNPMILPIIMET